MKIYCPNVSDQKIGGGWTFLRNFKNYFEKSKQAVFVDNWQDSDIVFVCGVTLADPGELEKAKQAGKAIVFRVDNIPKKSRNKRSRVYDNMRKFSKLADMVVFQSRWSQDYAGYLCRFDDDFTGIKKVDPPQIVIYNGVDQEIFYPSKERIIEEGITHLRYLFVHYNRDENKRFPEAAYHFHMRFRQDSKISLTLVGQFSPELVDAGFDFFAGEDVEFLGPVGDPKQMAEIYREHDVLLFPAFADAAPNTVLEARACGLTVELVNDCGGTKELLDPDLDISLERMGREYYGLFNLLLSNSEINL